MKLLIASVVLAFSFVSGQEPPPKQSSPPPPQGRYQIVFSPYARATADTYLLDTQTGRIWRTTKFTDVKGEPDVWMLMDRVDNDQEFGAWASKQTLKSKNPEIPK